LLLPSLATQDSLCHMNTAYLWSELNISGNSMLISYRILKLFRLAHCSRPSLTVRSAL